jgi:hypothetical protein
MDQDLAAVAHAAYLDELIELQEGWEKFAAKKKEGPTPGQIAAVGAPAGGVVGAQLGGAAGTAAEIAGGQPRLKHQRAISQQEKLVSRLESGLAHAKKQKAVPGVAETVAAQNIPKQQKQLELARAALKRLKGMKGPPKSMGWKVPAAVVGGATLGAGVPAAIAGGKYLKSRK